jgi:orotate phosphoribosyltransferase
MEKEAKKALRILKETGAIVFGHFVLASSNHSLMYVNKDAVYMHPEKISLLCRYIARQFIEDRIEVVVAPALGGIVLTQWVAYHLQKRTGRTVLAVYAEKDGHADSL